MAGTAVVLLSLATATHTRAALQPKPPACVRARHPYVLLQAESTSSRRRGRLRFGATNGPASWLERNDGPWSPGYWVEVEGGPDDGRYVVIALADIGPVLKEGGLCCVEPLGEDGSRWRCVVPDDGTVPSAVQLSAAATWRARARQVARPLSVVASTVALGVCLAQFAPRPGEQESLVRCERPLLAWIGVGVRVTARVEMQVRVWVRSGSGASAWLRGPGRCRVGSGQGYSLPELEPQAGASGSSQAPSKRPTDVPRRGGLAHATLASEHPFAERAVTRQLNSFAAPQLGAWPPGSSGTWLRCTHTGRVAEPLRIPMRNVRRAWP